MTDTTRRWLDFLRLGHSPEDATGWPHPATLHVRARGTTTLVYVSMGPHIVNVGGQVPLDSLIIDGVFNESYAEEFDSCDARWLVPFLVRLAAGERVTDAELVTAYRAKYGRDPRVEKFAVVD